MKINLLTIGKKLPSWINQGVSTYLERLPKEFAIELNEIAAVKAHKGMTAELLIKQESDRLLASIPLNHFVIALDRSGEQVSTTELARKIVQWQLDNRSLCFLIGGAEGLSRDCLNAAHWCWSLSKLTFPHPIARLLVAEQIYRAWSIIRHHPYHR